MDRVSGRNKSSLPPGFRFHPTDEELMMYHLRRKVLGRPAGAKVMSEIDVYSFGPWDLPAMACLKSRDLYWYFLCPKGRKYGNGGRTNRATECGYWKSTGNDRTVKYRDRVVGKIKTLIFHLGKAPKGERTDWVMHEYRLEDKELSDMGVAQDAFVICKVYEKGGIGPRIGERHVAQFVEEEWDSDDDDDNMEIGSIVVPTPGHVGMHSSQNGDDVSTLTANDNVSAMTMETCDVPGTATSAFYSIGDYHNISTVAGAVDTSVTSAADEIIAAGAVVVAAAAATPSTTEVAPIGVEPLYIETAGDDELDNLLAMFTAEESNVGNQTFDTDIFSGLEDLANGFLELDDLK